MLLEKALFFLLLITTYLTISSLSNPDENYDMQVGDNNVTFHHNGTINPDRHIDLLHEALKLPNVKHVDISFRGSSLDGKSLQKIFPSKLSENIKTLKLNLLETVTMGKNEVLQLLEKLPDHFQELDLILGNFIEEDENQQMIVERYQQNDISASIQEPNEAVGREEMHIRMRKSQRKDKTFSKKKSENEPKVTASNGPAQKIQRNEPKISTTGKANKPYKRKYRVVKKKRTYSRRRVSEEESSSSSESCQCQN